MREDLHPAAERLAENRVSALATSSDSAALERLVQRVHQPRQEVHSVALRCELEPLLAAQHDRLQELVWRHVGLEVARIPQFPDQLTKPLHENVHLVAGREWDTCVVGLLWGERERDGGDGGVTRVLVVLTWRKKLRTG